MMLAFFIIIWASDVGAYCVGMLLGKYTKKLFPSVSPKKSWRVSGAVWPLPYWRV